MEVVMIHFRPGSQMYQLLTLLSVVGEFPLRSIHLLGNERVYKTLIFKLTSPQIVREYGTEEETRCRLLTLAGKGAGKAVRLYKGALPLLKKLGAYEYYMEAFWGHRFPGDAAHRERNFRVAEAVALCMHAGVETRPYVLPKLQNRAIVNVVPMTPSLYLSKELKRVGKTEMNKTMYVRMIGSLFSGRECFAVYNTRNAAMKWNGMGEFKALHHLIEIGRMNAGIGEIDSAILMGESDEIAIKTLAADRDNRRSERFDGIYRHIYFVPLNEFGGRLLRVLITPNRNEKLLGKLFPPNLRSYDRGAFEYDAYMNRTYILSHLDGDIGRLIRFREGIENQHLQCEVLCYPEQVKFLKAYLGELVSLKTISLDAVESALK